MGWLIDKIRSWFCEHEWELLSRNAVYDSCDSNREEEIPIEYRWVYVCKKCMRKKVITTNK